MADRLSVRAKAAIAARSARWFVVVLVRLRVRREPLPALVASLGRVDRVVPLRARPVRLGRIVAGTLRLGPFRARCLYTAMVLYRLLREQGDEATLVIGLPREPRDKDAHAWVELEGRDVGPPPGRGRHQELARYA
jgi:transglutaminase-like putative cysteine protease